MRALLLAALLAPPSLAAFPAFAAVPITASSPQTAPAVVPSVAADTAGTCDGKPVIMVVRGLIHDMGRLRAYGQALAASGLYPALGGYYLNAPRAIAVFEGNVPKNESILMVRFPCLAHAKAFWNSRAYQDDVRPMRLDPSAGDFTVSVYPETAIPAYMDGRVVAPAFTPAIPDMVLPARK